MNDSAKLKPPLEASPIWPRALNLSIAFALLVFNTKVWRALNLKYSNTTNPNVLQDFLKLLSQHWINVTTIKAMTDGTNFILCNILFQRLLQIISFENNRFQTMPPYVWSDKSTRNRTSLTIGYMWAQWDRLQYVAG